MPFEPIVEKKTARGFQLVEFQDFSGGKCCLQQSSSIADTSERAVNYPGSSALWFGVPEHTDRCHLDRATVGMLVERLQRWLETGRLY